ncbi:hypothetical protein FQB35_09580 [Crassaminicella thermophila]|uniref:Uncharacterized protein n=1 Tax=Crassaminicella thermophila TaxID=2599308 RepID=A0A5C0SDD4_CRATE|nr:hypothetical protein [Crassaminicella thermophila]QEK12555.1 hypothetical protein FQB35_09580 [Crassaminicella thermophila]
MRKNFNLFLYIIQYILGILCSFIGQILLRLPASTWYTLSNTNKNYKIFIQSLANHAIAGIILAFIGFALLFYLIFITAILLLSHWNHIKWIFRIFIILWVILLCLSTLYHAVILYQILSYLFILALAIFSLLLILNYFHHERG